MRPKITPDEKSLFEAILSLESVQECAAFFEDVCTIKEIQDISQRYAVAKMLDSGEKYQSIEESTGAEATELQSERQRTRRENRERRQYDNR